MSRISTDSGFRDPVVLQQTLGVERLKDLAKVVDITEHSDELAHGDLHMVQAAFRDTAPYAGPYGLATPSRLSRIEVCIPWWRRTTRR